MRPIIPVAQLGRLPEHGRLRFGVRSGKAMKSIPFWRFTSADELALKVLAERYGGHVQPWSPWPGRQNPGPPQYEVISTSREVGVYLPPHALSVFYELWTQAGLQRRCDGVDCEDQGRPMKCVCDARQQMQCRPHTRLNVILPEVRFAGTWRMETHGWNATHHLSEMERTLLALQETTRVPLLASLVLVPKERMKGGQKQQWMEPELRLDASPEELLAGQGRAGHPSSLRAAPDLRAIEQGGMGGDDVVIEAEVVEEDDVTMKEWAERIQARIKVNELDEALLEAAPELVRRFPFLGPDDEALFALAKLLDASVISWKDLSDDEKGRLLRAVLDVVAGGVRIDQTEGGGLRLVRVRK